MGIRTWLALEEPEEYDHDAVIYVGDDGTLIYYPAAF